MRVLCMQAEIVGWPDFAEHQIPAGKGLAEVKAKGAWRQEGKKYVMGDGDITFFKTGAGKKK